MLSGVKRADDRASCAQRNILLDDPNVIMRLHLRLEQRTFQVLARTRFRFHAPQ